MRSLRIYDAILLTAVLMLAGVTALDHTGWPVDAASRGIDASTLGLVNQVVESHERLVAASGHRHSEYLAAIRDQHLIALDRLIDDLTDRGMMRESQVLASYRLAPAESGRGEGLRAALLEIARGATEATVDDRGWGSLALLAFVGACGGLLVMRRRADSVHNRTLSVSDVPSATAEVARDGSILAANADFQELWQALTGAVTARHVAQDWQDLPAPIREWSERMRRQLVPQTVTVTAGHGAGTDQLAVRMHTRLMAGTDRAVITLLDESERRDAERREKVAQVIFDAASESIVIADPDGVIELVNPAFCASSGYTEAECIGQSLHFVSAGHQGQDFIDSVEKSVCEKGFWTGEVWNRRRTGEAYIERASHTAIYAKNGVVDRQVCISTDITSSKNAEKLIVWQANHDALTKLPNRSLFQERLSNILLRARRDERKVALLFMDLDRFKAINDTLGHAAGDQLLIDAAHRLALAVRESDTVARLGGDEFTVILPDIERSEDVEKVARKILERMQEPFDLSGREAFVTASIGITMSPRDGEDVDTLVQNADAAMYRAKEQGRNGYCFFESEINAQASRRMEVENELRHAIEEDQFELYYQPIVDLARGPRRSAEALLRWHHPEWGMVSPGEFMPIAEETGLIVPLGEWIVESAMQQAERMTLAGRPVRIAVNLSGRQLLQASHIESLDRLLDDPRARSLNLEITESLLMRDSAEVLAFFEAQRERGLRVALDDFGTGYSSLSYLRRFPIDILKIDKSFVDDIETNTSDLSLIATIISMGRTLGVQVVAEGVETASQSSYLKSMGCDYVQGFHFCRPVPAADFEQFVRDDMHLRLVG